MPTKSELKNLAKLRLKEAEKLYAQGLYDGACYLGGYAIELALKARICKFLQVQEYPIGGTVGAAYKTHDIDVLVILAGLKAEVERIAPPGAITKFSQNWHLIKTWKETWRYDPKGSKSKINARDFLEAINDPKDGIFPWIKNKW